MKLNELDPDMRPTGAQKDLLDIVESETPSVVYACPPCDMEYRHCGAPLPGVSDPVTDHQMVALNTGTVTFVLAEDSDGGHNYHILVHSDKPDLPSLGHYFRQLVPMEPKLVCYLAAARAIVTRDDATERFSCAETGKQVLDHILAHGQVRLLETMELDAGVDKEIGMYQLKVFRGRDRTA
ncbi:MAG: hypothetical protein ABIE94_03380 [archaeon]